MKRFIAGVIFILCLASGWNVYSQPQGSQGRGSPDDSRGQALYRNNCQFCHGVNGSGDGPASYSMNPRPADFTNPQFWKSRTNEEIVQTIRNGRGMMPAFRFSREDIKALTDYISHFQKKGRSGRYSPDYGSRTGSGYGGYGRGYGRGPGMMGGYGRGYGMGPGMMGGYGRGYGMGRGMMGPGYGYEPQYRPPAKPLDEKDAKAQVEDYLKATGNPNLKMGRIKDTGNAFEVEIVTKNNALVDKILVDKKTGWMSSGH